jgi:hypothetical protein
MVFTIANTARPLCYELLLAQLGNAFFSNLPDFFPTSVFEHGDPPAQEELV